MKNLTYLIGGIVVSMLIGFCTSANAYTVGELDTADLTLMTLENSPQTRCSLDAPQIMVSNDAEFEDAYVGQYMFSWWDLEKSDHASERLQKENVPLDEYERYVTFAITQPDVTGLFGEGKETLSYGWKYAKLLCEYTNNGVCVDPNGNPISLDQYVGVVATDYPRTNNPIAECPVIEPDLTDYYVGTTQKQLEGLLDQLTNLLSELDATRNLTDMEKIKIKLASITDLFGKPSEVLFELDRLRAIVESRPELATDY